MDVDDDVNQSSGSVGGESRSPSQDTAMGAGETGDADSVDSEALGSASSSQDLDVSEPGPGVEDIIAFSSAQRERYSIRSKAVSAANERIKKKEDDE